MAQKDSEQVVSDDHLEQWLSQRKREREDEIRHVQSVVAKESNDRRLHLENLFESAHDSAGSSTSTQTQHSEYVLEVDYLIQRRPVTSLSANFRRQLERTLFDNNRSILSTRPIRPTPPAPSTTNVIPTPPTPPPVLSENRNAPNQHSPRESQSRSSPVDVDVRPPIAPRVERLVDPDVIFRDNSREEFVEEISQLLSRHPVGNTLESDFRNILENSLQRHLDMMQVDVRPTLEALSRLPPSGRRRNDFRDFGIIPPEDQDLDEDTVSIISATARAVPHDQRTSVLAKEVSSLRKEMLEMKSTLSMLFEAQLETQRCIRQELSAALSTSQSRPAAANILDESPGRRMMNNADNKCLICLSKAADTILYRCGHLCLCYQCSLQLSSHQHQATCPVCRAPVVDTLRVYIPGSDL